MVCQLLSDSLLKECLQYSDMTESGLRFVGESFIQAHRQASGGLSIEIGSRQGGSALLQLMLLRQLYKDASRPYLFTVDPYGFKPYKGGDTGDRVYLIYGDKDYVAMKKLLAEFDNHVHWYLESACFLPVAPTLRYWGGSTAMAIKGVAFVLLDGDHDKDTILEEIKHILPLMNKAGLIVIDNIDKDPGTKEALSIYRDGLTIGPSAPHGALQARISMERLHV